MAKINKPKAKPTTYRDEKLARQPTWQRDRYEQRSFKAGVQSKRGSF